MPIKVKNLSFEIFLTKVNGVNIKAKIMTIKGLDVYHY